MTSINMGSMNNDTRDRLSELPDDILVHILSFLPILDAVRTVSIRRFGNLWTLLPSLKFKDVELVNAVNWPDITTDYQEQIYRFTRFVRNVLMLHQGFPVNEFLLLFYDMDVCDDDHDSIIKDITLWIRFAIGRQVRKLQVGFEFDVYEIEILPQCVFTSQFLVELKLNNCRIQLLSQVQMGSLRKLSLIEIMVRNETFEKIISGCPSLQELVMRYVYGVNEVRFTNPNIEKLDISSYGLYELDCPNVKILNIHLSCRDGTYIQGFNIPSVHEVHVQSVAKSDEIVNKICNVEVVKFSEKAFQNSNLNELDIPKTRWKCLHIESRLTEYQLIIGICRVLKSSPHLEELVVFSNSRGKTCDHHMPSEELSFPCEAPQLKAVTICGHRVPCEGLLRLTEFLLRCCVKLEKMVILPSTYRLGAVSELKFVKQLLSFPRASANATVICGSEIY